MALLGRSVRTAPCASFRHMKKLRVLFVMDPIASIHPSSDTTFAIMEEAQGRGHEVFHCEPKHLELRNGQAWASVAKGALNRSSKPSIQLQQRADESVSSFGIVFIRKDPPFDDMYLWTTLVLEHAPPSTRVLNNPRGLRECNEKLYACQFAELMPPTRVTSSAESIMQFMKEVDGYAVIKPLSGKAGEGIMALREGDLNVPSIIETLTQKETQLVMVQAFLPASREGDKRVILLNGEPLGVFIRVPRRDDLRSNVRVGGAPQKTALSEQDLHVIETIKPHLQRDGLWFVGLDLIGGKLTEVNVTSPTGLQPMSQLYGRNLATPVIEALEQMCAD